MLQRSYYLNQLQVALDRSPITALLGPHQCGKTTLARQFADNQQATCFDMESMVDQRRLQNPELVLGSLHVEKGITAPPLTRVDSLKEQFS